jgi:hypothetical protein
MTALSAAIVVLASSSSAEHLPVDRLLEETQTDSAQLRQDLVDTLGSNAIQKGVAWAGLGPDFVFAVQADTLPASYIDDYPAGGQMQRLPGTSIFCYYLGRSVTQNNRDWNGPLTMRPLGSLDNLYQRMNP